MDPVPLKLLLLLVMIGAVLIAGLLPLRVLKRLRQSAARASSSKQHRNVSLVLCLLTCFSGGVFLATCFLHLFPELSESVQKLNRDYCLDISYPIAELLSCVGFFLLFFVEEVVIMAIPSMAHGHSHGHPHGHASLLDENPEAPPCEERGKSEEQTGAPSSAGCCMVSGAVPTQSRRAAAGENATEKMLVEAEAEGHCQKHCPFTVHRRHSAGANEVDCNSSSPEVYTAVILAEPERCETNCEKVDEDPPILMKSSPHAHSHGVRSITFVVAISFHALIEGMAFGVQTGIGDIVALFFSLLVHKLIVAFSVGLQLARTHAHALHWVVLSMIILSLTSPLGALVGMVVQGSSMNTLVRDCLVTVFQGLSVGTFLYVTFFEVLLHERDNEHPNLLKLLLMLLGFGLIGLLRLADGHDHEGEHSHSHSPPACSLSDSLLHSTTPNYSDHPH